MDSRILVFDFNGAVLEVFAIILVRRHETGLPPTCNDGSVGRTARAVLTRFFGVDATSMNEMEITEGRASKEEKKLEDWTDQHGCKFAGRSLRA